MSPAPHKIPLQEWVERVSSLLNKLENSYHNELREELFVLHNDKYLPRILNVSDDEFSILHNKMKLCCNHIIHEMKKSGLHD